MSKYLRPSIQVCSQRERIESGGPLQTTELSAQLRNVQLPGEGTYEFQLHANDQLVATKAIRVMKVETGAAPPPPTGTEPKA